MSPCGGRSRCQVPPNGISEPMAQAASSITGRPWARATGRIAARSQGMPIWCTQRIARVRGVIARGDRRGVDVEAVRLDVDEDRRRAALADGVGRGDEGVADGDDLVARADADARAARGAAPSVQLDDGAGVRRRRRARRTRASKAATCGPCVSQPERITALGRRGLLRRRAAAWRSGSRRRLLDEARSRTRHQATRSRMPSSKRDASGRKPSRLARPPRRRRAAAAPG